jgi:hypothetical protein
MFEVSDDQFVGGVIVSIWIVLGFMVANMMLGRLRGFFKEFVDQGALTRRVDSGETKYVSGKTLRGRPAYEGRSRTVPR